MGHGQVAEFIMEQCWRGLGQGQLFLRRDGLENTPERVAARHAYLEAYPDTRPEYRRAILEAGITPGMMRRETVAAWGLDEKELGSFSCRSTASGDKNYYSYHGLKIGGVVYTWYVSGDTLSSVSYEGEPDVRPLTD